MNISAELVSIGDELLIGQVINTNASWMAGELNKQGIQVVRITSVSDTEEAITTALDEAFERAEVVLMTGGLGPTKDDLTKHVLARYFGSSMIFHQPTYEHIQQLFGLRNYPVTEVNRLQAEIPDACIPLHNAHGTAPGMWFERNGRVAVSMPGVPFEMKALMTEEVLPRLRDFFHTGNILHKTIMTQGMGESALAERIQNWEEELPEGMKLAYLPQPGIVRLRLSVSGDNEALLRDAVNEQCRKLTRIIPELVFGFDDILLEEVIGKRLLAQQAKLSTAESCTGGYLAHLITSVPGSSAYFEGSVVSYSNEAKHQLLQVDDALISEHGAVSREVVEAMARGAQRNFATDYALATSGIAGPDGGTEEKPVGTVWIALAGPEGVTSQLFRFGEHRQRNIRRSALAAMNMLRKALMVNAGDDLWHDCCNH